jgi:hypothetical protein
MSKSDQTRDTVVDASAFSTDLPVGEVRFGVRSRVGRRAYLLAGMGVTAAAAVMESDISGVSHSSGLGGG